MGCGSSGPSASVESELFGVYELTSVQSSPTDEVTGDPIPESCDDLGDLEASGFLVLYNFNPNDDPESPLLAGVFCSTVEACQEAASEQVEPSIGYSFSQGGDADGWTGFAISSAGPAGDQCGADVQEHNLTASGTSISITTDTVEVVFPPMIDGTSATCSNRDALRALNEDLPCKSRLVVSGTRSADL